MLNGDLLGDLPFKLRLRGSAGGPLSTSFASLYHTLEYVHRGLREHRPRSFRKRLAWGLGAFPLRIEIWSRRLAPSWGCGTGHVQESSCCMLLLVKAPSSSCFWRGLWGQEAIPTDARCLEAGYCERRRRRIGLRPPASSSSVVAKNIYTGSPHFDRFRFFPRPRTKWNSHNVKKICIHND